MDKTTNYNLYLCGDDSKRFKEWREEINGTDDSNMIKIDTVLKQKADNSVSVDATLLASAWSGADVPYTQSLSVANLTAGANGIIAVASGATAEEREMARNALLSISGQADGVLTVAADGNLPEIDIPVSIILLG